MIDINLISPEFRRKKKKTISPLGALKIPREAIIGLIGGLFVLLIIIHIGLQLIIFFKFAQYNRLKQQWDEIRPQKEKVDMVLKELRSLQNKLNSIDKVTTEKRIFWAPKLNAISDALSKGVWLKKLSLDGDILIIEGSTYSKHGDEMLSVGTFVSNLKRQKGFMKDLANIEVGSIQRGKIKTVDIANFLITMKLKKEKDKKEK